MLILADRGDEGRIIGIERQKWLHDVLIALGAKEENLNTNGIEVKEYLSMLELEVWEHDEELEIKKASKLVAQWKKPRIIVRKENNGLYVEIHLNEWAQPFQLKRGR